MQSMRARSVRNGGADFEFVRNFSGSARPYNFSDVKFPGHSQQLRVLPQSGYLCFCACWCADDHECHDRWYKCDDCRGGRSSCIRGEPTDIVIPPFAAACYSCHNSPDAIFHITVDKGTPLDAARSSNPAEGCATCHGAGRTNDPVQYHRSNTWLVIELLHAGGACRPACCEFTCYSSGPFEVRYVC